MTATLDPDTIAITQHAIERYCERRKGTADREWAAAALRDLVARCQHQSPPVRVMPDGRMSRRYKAGRDMFLIVSPDYQTLITFYPNTSKSGRKRRN